MAILNPVRPKILASRVIANVDPGLAARLQLKVHQRSIGLLTCNIDDSLYVALDEATKFADVEVIYAHSFYAGSAHASGPLSGEIIGILAGPTPSEVHSGMRAAIAYAEERAPFYTANEAGDLTFFAHLISNAGSYLSDMAGIAPGQPLAYLIAPPLEAVYALDAAMKAAEVRMCDYFAPPSETNFAGGLLTGSQSACQAACVAFQDAVLDVAAHPNISGDDDA